MEKLHGLASTVTSGCEKVLGRYWIMWTGIAGLAFGVHAGTALLRFGSFFPHPRLLDFGSYYVEASAYRLGLIGSEHWSDVVQYLTLERRLIVSPTPSYSPPLWQMMIMPFTVVDYPVAATLWLLLLVAACIWVHFVLVRLAGITRGLPAWLSLPLTLTFGPLFLNLTLGQNGPILLLCTVLLSIALEEMAQSRKMGLYTPLAILAWVTAVAAKLYPLMWLGSWLAARRWRQTIVALATCFIAFAVVGVAQPKATFEYWNSLLPDRARAHTASSGIDDQSVVAFVGRLSHPLSFQVSGIDPAEEHQVAWNAPWDLPGWLAMGIAVAILAVLGGLTLRSAALSPASPHRAVYAIVLYTLMLVPHMERYNHILVIPPLAYLWQHGPSGRRIAIAAYALFAMSRLNHLWVRMPFPLGPVFSGFGLLGVLVLWYGICVMRPSLPVADEPRSAG